MKSYDFIFTLGGKDANQKPVNEKIVYSQTFKARTQETAEKKLRGQYLKSVIVHIQSVKEVSHEYSTSR